MLESIWFKIVYLLPQVIMFILIPLGILWIAFKFLKPKSMTFLRTIGIMVLTYLGINILILILVYVLGFGKSSPVGSASWLIGFILFIMPMKKYHKMSELESFKLFILIAITSLAIVFSISALHFK